MTLLYRVVRSDGQVVGGPYRMAEGQAILVDIPPAGTWTYTVQAYSDAGYGFEPHTITEARLISMVIKR